MNNNGALRGRVCCVMRMPKNRTACTYRSNLLSLLAASGSAIESKNRTHTHILDYSHPDLYFFLLVLVLFVLVLLVPLVLVLLVLLVLLVFDLLLLSNWRMITPKNFCGCENDSFGVNAKPSINSYCNRKPEISNAPTKAKSQEPAYLQALN